MLKKARLLTRSTPARQDAPFPAWPQRVKRQEGADRTLCVRSPVE